jgi:predicted DNA-binding transcriptional regulator AlpA
MPAPRNRDRLPDAVVHFASLPDEALIDVHAVALIRSESVSTVWRRVQRGEIDPPIKTGPNSTRFRVGGVRRSLRGEQSEAA